jgi:hypothetical protein
VRAGNRVGYYDRIIQMDCVEPFSEIIQSKELKTKYPVHSINFIGSLTQEFTNDDIVLFDDGTLGWKDGREPVEDTRISINYMHHPVWVVIEFLNANRTTLVKQRRAVVSTPQGETLQLPIKVLIRREYLPADPE